MSNCGVYVIHHGAENYPEFENNCVLVVQKEDTAFDLLCGMIRKTISQKNMICTVSSQVSTGFGKIVPMTFMD